MTIIKSILVGNSTIKWPTCSMKLNIDLLTYENGKKYYDITYIWNIEIDNLESHPFYEDKEFLGTSINGDIICQNSLTDSLIEYLQMPDDMLIERSGSTTPQEYRKLVMKSISLFWD